MKKCPYCGKMNSEAVEICGRCYAALEAIARKQEKPNDRPSEMEPDGFEGISDGKEK